VTFEDPGVSVPASASEVTDAWLARALAASFPGGAPRLETVERIGETFGLASVVLRCRLRGPGVPASLVVKLWATDGPGGTRELHFHDGLAARCPVRMPRTYHGGWDRRRERAVLVLEDLVDAVQGDCLMRANLPDARSLAHTLAALHAAWWGDASLARHDWLPSLARSEREPEWFVSRREKFLQRFGGQVPPRVRRVVERVEVLQAQASERLAVAPETLLHGDLHLDNVLFEGTGRTPVVLDWARVGRGPAVLDVGELVWSIAPAGGEAEVLGAYTRALAEHGVPARPETTWSREMGGALLRKSIRETCGVAGWEPTLERERRILEVTFERLEESLARWEREDPGLFGA